MDKLLERQVPLGSRLKLNVSFLRQHQVVLRELSLVRFKFFLEVRHFALSLPVAQLAHLVLMLGFLLLVLVEEVLFLGLDNDRQLGLLTLDLLD